MSQNKITNLTELRQRKEELKLEMMITRQAFGNSLRQSRRDARRAFINGVLIPLGLGSLTSLFFSQQRASGEKPDWLLFLEQAVGTVAKFYEQPDAQNGQEGAGQREQAK